MTTEPLTRAQPLWLLDTLVYIHVDGEQSGGAYSLSETWGARGNMPPLHVHRRNDETFYVLEGDVRLFLGDREIMLAPGQAALAPRGVPHNLQGRIRPVPVDRDQLPAGFEQFLRAASEPAPRAELPPAGRPGDTAELARAAADQGIEILGPPGVLPTRRER
jgi:quercetin dioxygenase-like cupin family protein